MQRETALGLAAIPMLRPADGEWESLSDRVAVEEPLEIRIAGEPFAVTMRTPGHDAELVLGFLLAEGVVATASEVGGMAHCGRPGEAGNVIDVTSAPGTVIDWEREGPLRRATLTSSACGVCGRRSIDDLLRRTAPIDDARRFSAAWIRGLTQRLAPLQSNFAVSGGAHAAALFGADGELATLREDVGRHNAVDKVVGRAALDGRLPARGMALWVSGRASFELVQKAAVAQIPLLVSVSAPSSLAIALAEATRMTLVGFARGERFNVYTGAERIELVR